MTAKMVEAALGISAPWSVGLHPVHDTVVKTAMLASWDVPAEQA